MRTRLDKNRLIFHVYITMCAAFFLITVIPFFMPSNINYTSGENGFIEFKDSWKDENGSLIKVTDLSSGNNALTHGRMSQTVSIYNTIPAGTSDGTSLVFNNINCGVKVYVDDKQVYEAGNKVGTVYGISPGIAWNSVMLPSDCGGEELRIDVSFSYIDSSCFLNNFYLGDSHEIFKHILGSNVPTIIIFIAQLTLGVVFVFMDLLIMHRLNNKHALLYIGIFALTSGLWTIFESAILSLIFTDTVLIHTLDCMMLKLVAAPFMMYVRDGLDIKNERVGAVLICTTMADFVISTILNFTGVLDYHYTMTVTHILMVLSVIYTFISCVNRFKKRSHEENGKLRIFFVAALIFLAFVVFDVVRYYIMKSGDNGIFSRPATLFLITVIGCINLNDIIKIIKVGLRAETIGKIAYTDNLTQIGNTAAFKHRLDQLERDKANYSTIGIVQFDINNLKPVNDTYGHKAGDELISGGAELINRAFGEIGNCYRTGGDEFAAIVAVEHAPARCDEAAEEFEEIIENYNLTENKPFKMQIAYGMAFYDRDNSTSLVDVLKQADARMYSKKKAMKLANHEKLRSTSRDE